MLQKRIRRNHKNKAKKAHLRSILFILAVDISLGIVIIAGSLKLRQKQIFYQQETKVLQEKIEEEKIRSEEITEFEKYVKTDAYIEEVAREKLGLMYENEILLKKTN